jgi:uncharacterized protein with ACT and thioredoxin-like domain
VRELRKKDALEILEKIQAVVKSMPENIHYARVFIVDDGQGVLLNDGIFDAAASFGKEVERLDGFNKHWEYLRFFVGNIQIMQFQKRDAGAARS